MFDLSKADSILNLIICKIKDIPFANATLLRVEESLAFIIIMLKLYQEII